MKWNVHVVRNLSWNDLEAFQLELARNVENDPQRAHLLISEPQPTYTYGRSSLPSDRIWTEARCAEAGIVTQAVSRGGKWTYHGPGQLLVYPIVKLESAGYPRRGIAPFLRDLRSAMAKWLTESPRGIAVDVIDKPFGIFVGDRKLVSFGIAIHQGVCHHGLALYVSPQTLPFSGIHPCGVQEGRVTSLTELGHPIDWLDAASQLAERVPAALKGVSKSRGKLIGLTPLVHTA